MVTLTSPRRGLYMPIRRRRLERPRRCLRCGKWIMSDGYRLIDADGRMSLVDGSTLLGDEGDSCCCCPNCNEPGSSLNVTIADISACACAPIFGPVAGSLTWEVSGVNGVWNVPFTSYAAPPFDYCEYFVEHEDAVVIRRTNWSDEACSVFGFGPTERNNLVFVIRLRRSDCMLTQIEISSGLGAIFRSLTPTKLGAPATNELVCGESGDPISETGTVIIERVAA